MLSRPTVCRPTEVKPLGHAAPRHESEDVLVHATFYSIQQHDHYPKSPSRPHTPFRPRPQNPAAVILAKIASACRAVSALSAAFLTASSNPRSSSSRRCSSSSSILCASMALCRSISRILRSSSRAAWASASASSRAAASRAASSASCMASCAACASSASRCAVNTTESMDRAKDSILTALRQPRENDPWGRIWTCRLEVSASLTMGDRRVVLSSAAESHDNSPIHPGRPFDVVPGPGRLELVRKQIVQLLSHTP